MVFDLRHTFDRRWCIALLLVVAFSGASTSTSHADYFLANFYSVDRYDAAGVLVHEADYLGESVNGMTLGPDGYIYVTTNDLGTGSIYRIDPATNDLVDGYDYDMYPVAWAGGDFCNPPFSCPGVQYDSPGQMAFGPYNDLFAISYNFHSPPGEVSEHRVLRIDGATAAIESVLDGAIQNPDDPPDFARFTDIVAGFSNDVFVAKSNGMIQRHIITENETTLLMTHDIGLNRLNWMTMGPDGLLYIRNESDNSIVRFNPYSLTMETFVSSIPLISAEDSVGDLFFGPGGDLFVINPGYSQEMRDSRLLRFDGQSGEFSGVIITTAPDRMTSFGVGVFVPEPNFSGVLAIMTAAGAGFVRPRRKVQRLLHTVCSRRF